MPLVSSLVSLVNMDASVPIKDLHRLVAIPVNSMPYIKPQKDVDSDSDDDEELPADALDDDSDDEDFGRKGILILQYYNNNITAIIYIARQEETLLV